MLQTETNGSTTTSAAAELSDRERQGGPWPGPVAYRGSQRRVFIGREYETANLVSLIKAYPLVLLHAPSGAGKSSLVNAGVVPALEADGFRNLGRGRVQPAAEPGHHLPIELDDEGEGLGPNPYEAGLIASLELTEPSFAGLSLDERLVRRASRLDERGHLVPTVVVLDQFEEILQRCDDYADQQERFMAALQRAVDARPNLRVLFVARDDHLGPILRLGHSLTNGFSAQMHLDRMPATAIERLLEEPARRFGKEIDTDVIDRIRADVTLEQYQVIGSDAPETRETHSRYLSLLTLQVVARNLWHTARGSTTITLKHFDAVDGTDGALRQYYRQSVRRAARAGWEEEHRSTLGRIAHRSPDQLDRDIRRFFEDQLISAHDQRQLVPTDSARSAIGQAAIDVLDDHSIIRRLSRGPGYYELCHDSFVAPIRGVQHDRHVDEADELRRGRRRGWTLAGAVLAGSIGLFAVMRGDQATTGSNLIGVVETNAAVAPQLVGLSVGQARVELGDLGLQVDVNQVRSSTDPGQVVAQSPAPGDTTADTIVRLDVSAGPALFTRDDVVVTEPGITETVDVLANDEPSLQATLDLTIMRLIAPPSVAASIVDDRIEVLAREPGDHLVEYLATDGMDQVVGRLIVTAQPFEADLVASATQVGVGEPVTFVNNAASDAAVDWDFGDGQSTATTNGEPVTVTYDETGTFTVTMTATSESTGSVVAEAVEITVLGATQQVTVLSTSVNLRSSPGLGDDNVAARIEGTERLELEVQRQPRNGWYRIVAGDHVGSWIFGSLLVPQTGDLRVAVTVDGEAPELRQADGQPVDPELSTGRFVLVTGETEDRFEVLLPDGSRATVDRSAVAIVEPALETLELEAVPLG